MEVEFHEETGHIDLSGSGLARRRLSCEERRQFHGVPDRNSIREVRPAQRSHADRPRGPQGAHRGRQRLVPRGVQKRETGTHGIRPPLRAPDVQRDGTLARRVLRTPGGGRRHRHERYHQRRSHQLLRERPHERAGSGPVAGVGPHGPHAGGHYQGEAGRAARRGPEREAPGGESTVRPDLDSSDGKHVSGGPSLFLDHHRLHGGSGCRRAGRRQGVVQDLLRRRQRGAFRRRRRRRPRGEEEGRALLRRHPFRSPGGQAGSLGRQDDGDPPAADAGPRPSGPDLQGLERSPVGNPGSGSPGPGSRYSGWWQDLTALQTAGLPGPDRHGRVQLPLRAGIERPIPGHYHGSPVKDSG